MQRIQIGKRTMHPKPGKLYMFSKALDGGSGVNFWVMNLEKDLTPLKKIYIPFGEIAMFIQEVKQTFCILGAYESIIVSQVLYKDDIGVVAEITPYYFFPVIL